MGRASAHSKNEQWKEIRPLSLKWMKEAAILSPAGAVVMHLFNFGDVTLAGLNNMRWSLTLWVGGAIFGRQECL